ncbi:Hypothetical protein FKW44_020678 [Caligus rogercresseyi]|uniref:Uncharacterized protein n=1 Tax=Caligus rogercresseyi TaxID=217165 RepID=A0A7T8GQF1_CALRO|nr:Hypothetical protein FKW44_020678 [Caligus rogercresseyi]
MALQLKHVASALKKISEEALGEIVISIIPDTLPPARARHGDRKAIEAATTHLPSGEPTVSRRMGPHEELIKKEVDTSVVHRARFSSRARPKD